MRFFARAANLHLSHVFTRLKMHHHIYFDQFCPMLRKWAVKLDEIIGYGYHQSRTSSLRPLLRMLAWSRGTKTLGTRVGYHGRRANVDHVWKFQWGFCQGGHNYSCLLESVCNEFLLDLSKRWKRKNTWLGKESAPFSCACVHACVDSGRRWRAY